MKHHLLRNRLLSVVLALLMLCSNVFYAVPTAVSAAEPDTTSLRLTYYPYNAPFNDLIALGDQNINMLTCTMRNMTPFKADDQGKPADYDFTATVDQQEVTILEQKVVGYGKNVVALKLEDPKAGTYTVTATPKTEGGTTYTAELKLMDVVFNAEDGTFADESDQKTYKTVAAAGTSLRSSFKLPEITPPETKDFLGWSAQQNQTDYSNVTYTVPNEGGNLYAVYGEAQRVSYELQKDGVKLESIDFGIHSFGEKIDPLVLQIKNTGNVRLKSISNSSTLNNFTVQLSKTALDPGDSADLTITPKENLGIGTYEDKLNVAADRHFLFYDIKLTIGEQREVCLFPAAIEKTYGETKTAADITKVEVKTPGGSDAGVTFEELQVTLGSDGFSAGADANASYDYRIESVGNPNYRVTIGDGAGKVKVNKAAPVGNPEATGLHTGQKLSESHLYGTFTNSVNPDFQVTGTLRWENENEVAGETGQEQHRWVFTPDSKNYTELEGEVTVTVSPKELTVLIPNRPDTSATTFYEDYNKHPKSISFHTNREDHTGDITVEYALENTEDWTTTAPTNAGTWKVRATIPETSVYAAGLFEGFLIIRPREVQFSAWADSKVYDGTTDATVRVALSNTVGTDTVSAKATGSFSTADAENHKFVSITLTELVGKDAGNYAIPTSKYHVTAKILPREITLQPASAISKTYGRLGVITSDMFTADNLVPGESLSGLPLQFACAGAEREANVAAYPITVTLQQGNYTLKSDNAGTMTVNKATPVLREAIETSNGFKGGLLNRVTLSGEFINPDNHDMTVPGKLEWSNPDQVLPTDADTAAVEWKFTMDPAYAQNYNEPSPAHGTVNVTLLDKEPIDIQADSITETYNGKPHVYDQYQVVEEGLDTSQISVEVRYQQIPDDRMSTNPDKWTDQPPVDAGTYAVELTAKAGVFADLYADNSVIVTMTIAAAAPTLQTIPVLSVPEGTALKDIPQLCPELGTPKGIDGQPLAGEYQWMVDQMTHVTKDGETIRFAFFPTSPNYMLVYGSVTIKLAPDDRTISAVIYNLPPNLGYNDYAVVDIAESQLKAGDTVVFYTDADAVNPECDPYTISLDDLQTGKAVVYLDDDALFDDDYVIYARISNSQKNAANAVSYKPEIGFTVPESFSLDAHEAVLTANCTDASYKALLQSMTFQLEWPDLVKIAKEDKDALTITLQALSEGSTTLTVTMTFRHPDTERHSEKTIVLSQNVLIHSTVHKHTGTLVPAKEATCTEPGTQSYYVCGCGMWFEDADCSRQIDNHESIQTPVKAHSWSEDYKTEHADADKHYHICTVCGKTDAGALHEWNVEAATEETEKHCNICGYLAEAKLDHVHQGTLVPAKEATCTEPGSQKYYICRCGMWFTDEACTSPLEDHEHVVIPAKGHTWSEGYMAEHADTEKHYHVCAVCGTKDEGALHEWNVEAATEETDKHCNICQYVAEAKLEHVHQGTLVPAKEATCTEPGSQKYFICRCGMWFTDEACTSPLEDHEQVVIPAKGHTWSEDYKTEHADADRHYHVCLVCEAKDEGALHEWNVEAATEETDKHCNICQYVAEAKLDHVHQGTLVPAKEATAAEPGNKSYYVCDCGMWFEDETCTRLIEDHESVVIPPIGPVILPGDVNMDGDVTSADALLVLQHAARIHTLDEQQQALADLTQDGAIDAFDALEILRKAAKLTEPD